MIRTGVRSSGASDRAGMDAVLLTARVRVRCRERREETGLEAADEAPIAGARQVRGHAPLHEAEWCVAEASIP